MAGRSFYSNEEKKAIGNRIRVARRRARYTQDELAKVAGYHSKQAVTQLEGGKFLPPREKLEKIAAFLGVTTDYLTGESESVEERVTRSARNPAIGRPVEAVSAALPSPRPDVATVRIFLDEMRLIERRLMKRAERGHTEVLGAVERIERLLDCKRQVNAPGPLGE